MKTTRRDFLKTMTGIVVVVAVGDVARLEASLDSALQQRGYPADLNAYLRIAPDGKITVFSGKIEMGQGVTTSLAQMVAEELHVGTDAIEMVMGDTATCPYDAGTWGSLTTRVFGPALRAAAAQAREVLLELAAETLKVPAASLKLDGGFVSAGAKKVSFGQLANGKRIEKVLDRKAVVTAVQNFKVMGRPFVKKEARVKVTGAAKYAGDIKLPGMLCAKILRPSAHGEKLISADTTKARKIDGVTVVEQDGIVACLHRDPEVAAKALALVTAQWTPSPNTLDNSNIHRQLISTSPRESVSEQAGSIEAGLAASIKTFEQTYYDGYNAHSPIETHTALADVRPNEATLWVSTQSPFGDRARVAQAIGLPVESVRVITPQVGGGFGGKAVNQQAIEAAKLSKIVGKPVQLMWTRAEEFFYDTFHSAAVITIRSGIDANGKIVLWDYHVYGAGGRGAEMFYDVANKRVAIHSGFQHPFATGAWRAPGANSNTFAREQQIDIMAQATGMDPLEFRIRNTSDARMLSVLKAVQPRYQPGMGVACGLDAGSYVAHLAIVDLANQQIRAKWMLCAQEMGIVVNPEGAVMQMEGCMTMGLGYALGETINFKNGAIAEKNFDTFKLPRFSWLPEIETMLVKNDELAPQGGGEPAIICIGAVIANALAISTGTRCFNMPIRVETA